MLCSASVQEAHDMAAIATRATLESRIPFLHYFDGFPHLPRSPENRDHPRRSAGTAGALRPGAAAPPAGPDPRPSGDSRHRPEPGCVLPGAGGPSTATTTACADIVQQAMDEFAELTGRQYKIFEYHGAPDAERVVILMGSGCETAHEAVDALNAQGEQVGVLKVRLYRPFDNIAFMNALPPKR